MSMQSFGGSGLETSLENHTSTLGANQLSKS